jgi:NAD(P)-dependent dehydrogenase (short-subunit alcohol dehydrogenase family)
MLDFTNQVVLITGIDSQGSGSGNGRAIATLFARQGAVIYGCDLISSAAEATKTMILSELPAARISVMRADAMSSKSMRDFVQGCVKEHGRIDVLVNNVGKSEPGDPANMAEEIWDKQIEVNLKSVYLTCHLVLPIMDKQAEGGNIVNMASVAGVIYVGKPQIVYAATKAAVIQFTKVAAVSDVCIEESEG